MGTETEPHAFAYLDDIVVLGATKEHHVANLSEVFRRLRAANLKLKRKRLVYFDHLISGEWMEWICTDPETVEAIQNLKAQANTRSYEKLTTAPVLACLDFSARFFLQTDASDYTLGAVLTKTVDGQQRVIAYASRKLRKAEMKRWSCSSSNSTFITGEQAVKAEVKCKWIENMRARIAEEPAKFPDYIEENGQLFRHLEHRADDEDFIP
ncbi:hypothetical protein ACLKA6_016231 [Drosophila palustris]